MLNEKTLIVAGLIIVVVMIAFVIQIIVIAKWREHPLWFVPASVTTVIFTGAWLVVAIVFEEWLDWAALAFFIFGVGLFVVISLVSRSGPPTGAGPDSTFRM